MVAFAVINYWRSTGDDEWMAARGAEIVLDSARFWASRAEWREERGRYEITNVVGPDEYHEHVDNNAFTNQFAAWLAERTGGIAQSASQTRCWNGEPCGASGKVKPVRCPSKYA